MVKKLTYNVKETAEALGISSSLLYREIENGKCQLPYHKVGNRILFSIQELEAYFSGCKK